MQSNSFGSIEEELKKHGITREKVEQVEREALRGYVYIIKCNEFYKIGSSRDGVDGRLKAMQTGNPYKLRLILKIKIDNYPKAELMLHEHFKDKRRLGEWFELNDKDLKSLNGYRDE